MFLFLGVRECPDSLCTLSIGWVDPQHWGRNLGGNCTVQAGTVAVSSEWVVRMSGGQEAAWVGGTQWIPANALLPFSPLQVDCLGLWLAVELEPWKASEPTPGRMMVPLVPALVMLGLMAGAHGDSKSDSSSYR